MKCIEKRVFFLYNRGNLKKRFTMKFNVERMKEIVVERYDIEKIYFGEGGINILAPEIKKLLKEHCLGCYYEETIYLLQEKQMQHIFQSFIKPFRESFDEEEQREKTKLLIELLLVSVLFIHEKVDSHEGITFENKYLPMQIFDILLTNQSTKKHWLKIKIIDLNEHFDKYKFLSDKNEYRKASFDYLKNDKVFSSRVDSLINLFIKYDCVNKKSLLTLKEELEI